MSVKSGENRSQQTSLKKLKKSKTEQGHKMKQEL